MLSVMREHATSWIIKILLGAIIVVFIFWGVGSYREQSKNKAAMVNGEAISMAEYAREYERIKEQTRSRFGNVTSEILESLRVEETALDNVIGRAVLIQEAKRLQLKISDAEVERSVKNMPIFQNKGVFDSAIYDRILERNRLTRKTFEDSHREAMLSEKLTSIITSSAKVSDVEAREYYQWKNISIKVDYLLFDPATYTIEPADGDIEAWHEENKEKYKTEPKMKARFLRFDPKNYMSEALVSDEDIKDYYDERIDDFKKEKTVVASHILFKTQGLTDPAQIEEKRKKAFEIFEMAKSGQDFAELAKQHSDDPSKDRGGMLGEFGKGKMVKAFEEKAFSMKPGEISDPVKSPFGWHIIRMEKVNEKSVRTVEDAKDEIRKKLTDEKAKNLAYEDAYDVYDALFEGDDLSKLADQKRMIEETDFFSKNDMPDIEVKNIRKFTTVSFGLDTNQISEVQDLGDMYYLIQATEKIESATAELEDVRDKVTEDYIREKQDEKASANADESFAAIKNGETLEGAGTKYSLEVKTTDFFTRDQAIPGIGYEREITSAAFELSKESKLPEKALKGTKGYYVISFKEKKMPDDEAFEKEKDQTKQMLKRRKKYELLDQWLTDAKKRSEIETYVD